MSLKMVHCKAQDKENYNEVVNGDNMYKQKKLCGDRAFQINKMT